ncbi:basic helix-loop-helix (bHLH) DNA-binding superfamily protein [Rhynchospora pubera]|uniref:Basic helix-loop-helix (BHLH) DNA-binding superfamily protein n=1 Tax=Rhynchospora pubera TaxID=906938 RepID=A0AAV8EMZ1_9POAL|nr:basic helix-loop-helix (bHLH) DNA-binding superfamily protein [Rhynchospora pubera]
MDISPPPPPPPPHPTQSKCKPDRKTVEKNRRDHMKFLYSKLDSLIASSSSSASSYGQQLPDRLEEATNYIKRLQERIEQLKENKKQLIGSTGGESNERSSSPEIEVHDLGSGINAVLIVSSHHDQAIMHRAIRAVVEEGNVDVLNAHYSSAGDKSIVSLHTLVRDSNESGSGTISMLDRLKKAF